MSRKIEIAFVILHYIAIDDTIKCIDSIKKNMDSDNYCIIVVDNASPNHTGIDLFELFKDDPLMDIILSSTNLGFSKGNNLGFTFAKKLGVSFIVLLNNDILLLEKSFYTKVLDEYQASNFAVLGPLIMTADGRCDTNPTRKRLMTKGEVENAIKCKRLLLFFNKLGIDLLYLIYLRYIKQNIYIMDKTIKDRIIRKQSETGAVLSYFEHQEDVELHGCFWVFGTHYIERFDGLDSRPFMYSEEMILFHHMLNHHLKMVYCPDIIIYHAEAASTSQVSKKKSCRRRFVYENGLESLKILLEFY